MENRDYGARTCLNRNNGNSRVNIIRKKGKKPKVYGVVPTSKYPVFIEVDFFPPNNESYYKVLLKAVAKDQLTQSEKNTLASLLS